MADFIHQEGNLQSGSVVSVTLDQQANVLLLDDLNFMNYRSGRQFRYFGGLATESPFNISVPRTDHWHIVIDLGGASGNVRYSVNVLN